MRIVTNPGSNLSARVIERYGVEITPQRIVVDDQEFDTREPIEHATIDTWVQESTVHPYVIGTSAAEHAAIFQKLAREGDDIFVITTSKRVIKTYDAALSAARAVEEALPGARIVVADSGVTDGGTALAVILAAQALESGRTILETASLVDAFMAHGQFLLTFDTLDYLVKGGRATALRAWLANFFKIRPIAGFKDGAFTTLSKMKAGTSPVGPLVDAMSKKFEPGQRIWLAVLHGAIPQRAQELVAAVQDRFDVVFVYERPLSPSIYLHGGPGCLGLCAIAVDALPFEPKPPVF